MLVSFRPAQALPMPEPVALFCQRRLVPGGRAAPGDVYIYIYI